MSQQISGRMRGVFREWASGIVLRDIDRIWQAEGFAPGGFISSDSGQRRTQWAEYEAAVNWDDPNHTSRVLRVYESVVNEFPPEDLTRFTKVMKLDGWDIDDVGHIVSVDDSRLHGLSGLDRIRGADGIHEAFARVGLLLDTDPAGTVGAVKDLVESTAKTVVDSLDIEVPKNADMAWLTNHTQDELGLSASSLPDGIDGGPAIKRILGGLSGVVVGVVELRNAEGGGHGRTRRSRLAPRHARLAVNGARAWCEIVLDTLHDPDAPWRKARIEG